MTYGTSILQVIDTNDLGETLYRFPENDVFPAFSIFENAQGDLEVISDFQGLQPQSLDEVGEFDWLPIDMLGQF